MYRVTKLQLTPIRTYSTILRIAVVNEPSLHSAIANCRKRNATMQGHCAYCQQSKLHETIQASVYDFQVE